ncbi:MAG: alanine dehydrogenase [Ignavibacteriae bacterium]|nr:alanine dehydrogenase [Ignavibacteriota bacterium]MCB9215501.1 alanine dehydrogenase [Ignavibacteria bacterium]
MIIGVPREIKPNENRVGATPAGLQLLVRDGHTVLVETNAGIGSGYSDADYEAIGAKIVGSPADVYGEAEMIVKVKEPIAPEYGLIREGQVLFTYFHFAASRELTEAIIATKSVAIAYETVTAPDGSLPLLIPMSEVAGRMATQEGAKYLEKPMGGRGVLLGGIPGTKPANVLVLGGGIVGTHAAKIAAGFGANVTMMDNNLYRLRYLDDVMPKNVDTMMSTPHAIREAIREADLVIGAVLIPGAKAPWLITREMLSEMKPGSVIVDVSVDQGGCVETSKPTTHADPVYEVDGIVHYGVANMPGAVPFTSTIGLTNATLPYMLKLANLGYEVALRDDAGLREGLNILNGVVTYKGVAEAFGLEYVPVDTALGMTELAG